MTNFAWYRRLPVQLVALMTVALFPLGYAALYQSQRVVENAEENTRIALLALTQRAARSEQLLIERAVGAARLLGTLAPEFMDDPDRCAPILSRFIEENDAYSFIGILPKTGDMVCSSVTQPVDFGEYPEFIPAMQRQQPSILINESAPISGQTVFVVSEPFYVNDTFAGLVSASVPHSRLPDALLELDQLALIELITFNDNGTVLTARASRTRAAQELPADSELAALLTGQSVAFEAPNRNGVQRRYTVVPIEGSGAGVMGIWNPAATLADAPQPIFFAVLMWFATMGVAMLAMHALVLRHIYRMRRSITSFTTERQIDQPGTIAAMPAELQALSENFQQMTEQVLKDEALLEDAVYEKDVLVKEIHHRVKNNLQLISSILNMHIRTADVPETRAVLKRVQDRVLSLATIHCNLYQSQSAGRINVGALVTEIVERSVEFAFDTSSTDSLDVEIEDILLYPDQAVPLSLLVSEAVTNAIKYTGSAVDGAPWIEVRLLKEGDECKFTIANSVGSQREIESTGLGSQLMRAFAVQLNAEVETQTSEGGYKLTVRFSAQDFEPELRDF